MLKLCKLFLLIPCGLWAQLPADSPADTVPVGTRVNSLCSIQSSGFHVAGKVLVSNEVQADCRFNSVLTVGTLVNGVCSLQSSGFHVAGKVLVSNEVEGNCLLPNVPAN